MLSLAEQWRQADRARRAPDQTKHWDERSVSYAQRSHDTYATQFIEKVQPQAADVIFDMGCGTGSLAIPFAKQGCQVIAADFSSGMLGQLAQAADKAQLALVRATSAEEVRTFSRNDALAISTNEVHATSAEEARACGWPTISAGSLLALQMSWEDDWAQFGLTERCVDIAIASRSIITHDMEDSLRKLSRIARRKVCVSASTGVSPRVNPAVAEAMGLQLQRHNDALFVFGIAHELGYEPEVSYIHSLRTRCYASREEAHEALMKTMDYVRDAAQQVDRAVASQRLDNWLTNHLVFDEQANTWCIDQAYTVPWAFISWEV